MHLLRLGNVPGERLTQGTGQNKSYLCRLTTSRDLIYKLFVLIFRLLQEHYMYYPDFRAEPRDDIECRTAVMKEEAEALERKLFLEEIALDVTDERCDFLDRNLR